MERSLRRFSAHATGWHHVIKCLVDPSLVLGDRHEARGAFLCLKDMLWCMSSDALTLWRDSVAEVERLANAMPA